MRGHLLVMDSDPGDLRALGVWAEERGFSIEHSPSGVLPTQRPGAALVPIGANNRAELAVLRARWPGLPVIVLAADPDPSRIVAAVRAGADDVAEKPIDPRQLQEILERLEPREGVVVVSSPTEGDATRALRKSENPALHRLMDVVDRAAKTDLTVLIRGESGTGKELVARSLHEQSDRARGPFVKVNCAALPSELLESELFGFERGAFTGAEKRKLGKFEHAEGGTIFLDEIGEMELPLQAKLLQVLQDGAFCRLGGQGDVRVDTRIVTATNRDLEAEVAHGKFREDLFFRINALNVWVPPLRERKEDLANLAEGFAERFAEEYGKAVPVLTEGFREELLAYAWPGNVRELENLIRRFVVLGGKSSIREEMGQKKHTETVGDGSSGRNQAGAVAGLKILAKRAAQTAERRVMEAVLQETRWNRKEAARRLSISYKALLYKMKENGLREDG